MGHPQWIYHRTEEPRIIDSDDLAGYVEEGWATTPATFRQSKKERELRERLSALEKEALKVMDEINGLRKHEAETTETGDAPRPARKRRKDPA